MRHDEPAVVERADRQQVLGAQDALRRRSPSDRARARRRRVRWPRPRCRASSSASATGPRHHPPVEAGLGAVPAPQQRLATGGRDRLGVLAAGPDGRQHDACRARDDVGHRRGTPGPVPRVVPAGRGHQVDEPVERNAPPVPARAAAAPWRPRRARRTATVRCARRPRRRAGRRSRSRGPAPPRQGSMLGDLGQDRCQACDAGVEAVAIGAGVGAGPSSGTDSGSHGPSSSRSWLQTHRQRRFAQLPVPVSRGHPHRLESARGRPDRARRHFGSAMTRARTSDATQPKADPHPSGSWHALDGKLQRREPRADDQACRWGGSRSGAEPGLMSDRSCRSSLIGVDQGRSRCPRGLASRREPRSAGERLLPDSSDGRSPPASRPRRGPE